MIKRSKRQNNFTVVNNEIYAENRLSFEAIGLLTYLLSKPDNWQINPKALAKITEGTDKKTGINKIYSMLNVLINAGFIVRKKFADGTVEYTVYDGPVHANSEQQNPNHGNPDKANPNHGNPDKAFSETLIRTERQQELNTNKELTDNNPHTPKGGDNEKLPKINPDILKVFEHWKSRCNHPKAKLDTKRQKAIKSALSWGYPVEDLRQAIDGCSLTPFNQGQNDRGQVYDSLQTILKDADQVDRFMANALNPPKALNKQQQLEASNLAALHRYQAKKQGVV